ncbi:MAG: autotransporter outer membrane beta-barrel domain-containing protein [Magnetococcales bacterium]|nr:autotransporter outer membrane beta-barrel domain-containing protein [Magnetococcales bacterium]
MNNKLSIFAGLSLAAAFVMPLENARATETEYPHETSSYEYRCYNGYLQYRYSGHYASEYESSSEWSSYEPARTCADAATISQRTSVTQSVNMIAKQANSAVRGLRKKTAKTNTASLIDPSQTEFGTGISAGSGSASTMTGSGVGLWINYDYTNADNDQAQSNSDLHTVALGGDMVVREGLALGVALTGQWIDEKNLISNSDTSVFTLAPYAALMLTDYLTMDATLGYSWLSEDQKAAAANVSFDTNRWFGAANLTAFNDDPLWDVSFNLGYLFTQDRVDAFAAVAKNAISFAQVHAGAEVGYRFERYQPYVNAAYQMDLVYEANNATYDPNGAQLGAGVRLSINDRLQGEVQTSTIISRNDYDQYSLMGNLKYSF